MLALVILLLSAKLLHGHERKGFDDSIMFEITWPGYQSQFVNIEYPPFLEEEHITLTTAYKEKFKCSLPTFQPIRPVAMDNYSGPTPFELILPLFTQSSCSYRLESYWTYEVCHGRHIRQYHEDREGKKVKVQEYLLGQWPKNHYQEVLEEMKNTETDNEDESIPQKKIDGISLPYFQLTMKNGTKCELTKNHRQTKVLYVCYLHGKHEIFSFKEISTCVYEAIILSPLLCAHPRYKPQEVRNKQINCLALQEGPTRPRNLIYMNQEATRLRFKDIEPVRLEVKPLDLEDKEEEPPKIPETPVDTSPVESFLAGRNCLTGGTGWWKYEFCYGKYVQQFHIEKTGTKIAINLGRFNKDKHLEWLNSHPQKRPKPQGQRTQLSHMYADGSFCDKTGKLRQTEVKLKCLENAVNVNAVSLYLLEPRYCEYILGVESPLICNILARADDNGLVTNIDDDGIIEDEISTVNIIRV